MSVPVLTAFKKAVHQGNHPRRGQKAPLRRRGSREGVQRILLSGREYGAGVYEHQHTNIECTLEADLLTHRVNHTHVQMCRSADSGGDIHTTRATTCSFFRRHYPPNNPDGADSEY